VTVAPDGKLHIALVNLLDDQGLALTWLRCLRSRFPEALLLALGPGDDLRAVIAALRAGAIGYLASPLEPLDATAAIQEVLQGGAPLPKRIARTLVTLLHQSARCWGDKTTLTPREDEIMACLLEKRTYDQIGQALGISPQTVHAHVRRIFQKLGVHSQQEAVVRYFGASPVGKQLLG
jgi:DNA-binding NarL/FixJ family response regulator